MIVVKRGLRFDTDKATLIGVSPASDGSREEKLFRTASGRFFTAWGAGIQILSPADAKLWLEINQYIEEA